MEYDLKLTEQELKVILISLLEVPGKFGNPIINKINQQISKETKDEDRA